jgi:hypothetical protein
MPPLPSYNFDTLSGVEFETWVRRLLEENGFEVQGTPATRDQGADLIAKKNGKTIIVQAKRYRGAVGNKAVQRRCRVLWGRRGLGHYQRQFHPVGKSTRTEVLRQAD